MTSPFRERDCEDCGDSIPLGRGRIRCVECKKLVCSFCYNHGTHRRKTTPRGERSNWRIGEKCSTQLQD